MMNDKYQILGLVDDSRINNEAGSVPPLHWVYISKVWLGLFAAVLLFSLFCLGLLMGLAMFNITQSGDTIEVYIYDGKHNLKIWNSPPPYKELAKVARYVLHISEWGSLATISSQKGIEHYPFANVFSVSDGPFQNSTGIPYFYLTPSDLSVMDLQVDNKASLSVSLAQSDYCAKNKMDPEDPRCSHVIFSGTILKIDSDSEEEKFAMKALFSRHWEMELWPKDHGWVFSKMNITNIYVLDYFGGAEIVNVDEYFNTEFPV